MNKPRVKRPHFIPRTYLKNFTDANSKIWVYDKLLDRVMPQNIADTAVKKNLYTSDKYDGLLDIPEVTNLEGSYNLIVSKLEKKENVSSQELGIILNFIALQFLRTPAAKNRSKKVFNKFVQELKSTYLLAQNQNNSINKIEKIITGLMRDIKRNGISIEKFVLETNEYEPPLNFFLQTIASSGVTIINTLSKQKWQFLFADENFFISSDDPFTVFYSEIDSSEFSITHDQVKLIPLTKNVCVAIYQEGFEIGSKKLHNWSTKVLNLGITSKADRYVYSSSRQQLLEIKGSIKQFESNPMDFIPSEVRVR